MTADIIITYEDFLKWPIVDIARILKCYQIISFEDFGFWEYEENIEFSGLSLLLKGNTGALTIKDIEGYNMLWGIRTFEDKTRSAKLKLSAEWMSWFARKILEDIDEIRAEADTEVETFVSAEEELEDSLGCKLDAWKPVYEKSVDAFLVTGNDIAEGRIININTFDAEGLLEYFINEGFKAYLEDICISSLHGFAIVRIAGARQISVIKQN
jgi:hypothetical protein